MTLTPQHRSQIVLNSESQALGMASNNDPDVAAEIMQCCIDGSMNGLVRVQGARVASEYAYALADRVVSGVRMPTDIPLAMIDLPKLVPPPDRESGSWPAFFLLGMVVMWAAIGLVR